MPVVRLGTVERMDARTEPTWTYLRRVPKRTTGISGRLFNNNTKK